MNRILNLQKLAISADPSDGAAGDSTSSFAGCNCSTSSNGSCLCSGEVTIAV
ncbi:class III lanthipeptide [Lysobacter sp. Root690]|uniref:class III lanthipeptide n=1 Tax=Lysobacter sp. Root690 TaxID=1736588 RepID=UPI000A85E99C|nr:class III lanthipeptide [Lysobacter sp. Root690]